MMKIRQNYAEMDCQIRAMILNLKAEKRMDDDGVAQMIGMKGTSLRNRRCKGSLPQLPFCKIVELANQAGYDVQFKRKEGKKNA